MVIAGWEGDRESVDRRRELSGRVLRAGGAVPLGASAGNSWEHGRYDGPHLRDSLMDVGVLVETLETSHAYSRIGELYDARPRRAADAMGTDPGGIVMCHVSHAYRDGASLYFTFLTAARRGAEIEQWRRDQARRLRGDRRRRRARSPTTTPSAATTRPTCGPRSASSASRPCARSRTASTRPGS